ncbi:MAG TPA: tetratricopeptide repeat protein, partial [Acetobacteraceae bacterium]|nr:tetratricopeptide repeat protein [Acetobacteraceae bacterium]
MPGTNLAVPFVATGQGILSADRAADHAHAARRAGRTEEAIAWFRRALEREPAHLRARVELATTLREHGHTAEAECVYRALLADERGSWHALAGLGICARMRRDHAASADYLAAAVAAAPREITIRLEYATTLREQGRTAEAEHLYRGVLEDEPGSWHAHAGLGLCARMRNDPHAAIAHLTAATEHAPDAYGAWLELASAYGDVGRFDEARTIMRSLIDRGMGAAQPWVGLGLAERSAGNRAAALDAFRQGYRHFPERQQFMLDIAIEEVALGNLAEAERWFSDAAEIEALAGEALSQLGEMLRAARQPDRALEVLRRAVRFPAAPAWAHGTLAQTLTDLGRPADAIEVLQAAERQLGPRPEIAQRQASLLRSAGAREEALAVARSAVAASPGHFWLWYEWFENERLSGDFAGIDDCLAAAPARTAHERAHLHYARGLVAEQRWQLGAAADAFRQAIAEDASLAWMHESLARLSLVRFDIATAREHLLIFRGLRAATQRAQGLSPHLTHTWIGEVFNEFAADTDALDAITAAQALPAGERIDRLRALVRVDPEKTAPAIALLLALREAGAFASDDAETSGIAIPRTIMQYWDQDAPPEDVARLMQSWPAKNPAWRYIRFDDAAALAFLRERFAPEVAQAYARARTPAMKADLFRLAYLAAEGGCYVDADDRCLRPIEELLPPRAGFVAFQEDIGTLSNNFLAVAPLHPAIVLALDLTVTAVNRGDEELLWLSTGPALLTRAFAQAVACSVLRPAA